jgi:hypothetical protein
VKPAAMRRATRIGLGLLAMAATAPVATADSSGGVAPATTSSCPSDHPIKGYASQHSQAGVYYAPGSASYVRVNPERCFASETEARQAGYRAGREELPPATDEGRSRRRQP